MSTTVSAFELDTMSTASSSPAYSETSSPPSSTATSFPPSPTPTKALLLRSTKGPYTLSHNHPISYPHHNEVLIQNHAIGLNPIDWKCTAFNFGIHHLPWISGRESSGTIVSIGSSVTRFEPGDRVLTTSTNYRDNRTSTFQEFSIALEANTAHIPDQLSFSKAAALGVGVVAAAESLFNSLGLSFPPPVPPPASKDWILIWGGASVTGQFAIQFSKLHSLRIATVASPHNFAHLRSLGAEFLLDRYEPLAAVEALRPLKIKLALDCVGADTAAYATSALAEGGKVVCLVKKPKESQAGVELESVLIKRFHEDEAYGGRLMEFVEELLEQGAIVPPKTELLEGGLEAVEDGLRVLRKGVSGRKLVVRLVDGPAKSTDQ